MKAIDPARYEIFFPRCGLLAKKVGNQLRREYDLSQLKGGIRGKYYKRAMAGTNLVLIRTRPGESIPGHRLGEPGVASFS